MYIDHTNLSVYVQLTLWCLYFYAELSRFDHNQRNARHSGFNPKVVTIKVRWTTNKSISLRRGQPAHKGQISPLLIMLPWVEKALATPPLSSSHSPQGSNPLISSHSPRDRTPLISSHSPQGSKHPWALATTPRDRTPPSSSQSPQGSNPSLSSSHSPGIEPGTLHHVHVDLCLHIIPFQY